MLYCTTKEKIMDYYNEIKYIAQKIEIIVKQDIMKIVMKE